MRPCANVADFRRSQTHADAGMQGASRTAVAAAPVLYSVQGGLYTKLCLLFLNLQNHNTYCIDFRCYTVYSILEVIIMPTTKKRVNLALSEDVYERISAFMKKNGITSTAGACVMLIVQQLDSIDNNAKMMDFISQFPLEELQKLSNLGLAMVQQETQKQTD